MSKSTVTFHLDDDIIVNLKRIEMEFRKRGYKGFSRTFLLNAGGQYLVDIFDQEGFKVVEEIITEEWKKHNG